MTPLIASGRGAPQAPPRAHRAALAGSDVDTRLAGRTLWSASRRRRRSRPTSGSRCTASAIRSSSTGWRADRSSSPRESRPATRSMSAPSLSFVGWTYTAALLLGRRGGGEAHRPRVPAPASGLAASPRSRRSRPSPGSSRAKPAIGSPASLPRGCSPPPSRSPARGSTPDESTRCSWRSPCSHWPGGDRPAACAAASRSGCSRSSPSSPSRPRCSHCSRRSRISSSPVAESASPRLRPSSPWWSPRPLCSMRRPTAGTGTTSSASSRDSHWLTSCGSGSGSTTSCASSGRS